MLRAEIAEYEGGMGVSPGIAPVDGFFAHSTLSPWPKPAWKAKRVVIVTDAWRPQTNGVVLTLERIIQHLESEGVEVLRVTPDNHRTLPLPSYPEIRIACDPWRATERIKQFEPDAVHLATEGPLGFAVCAWLRKHKLRFTTSFHTRYPEYVSARIPVPVEWGYKLERWFHAEAEHTLVCARDLMTELKLRRIGKQLVLWQRGVDLELFHPRRRALDLYPQRGPLWLYVGRVAVEKSVEDFLRLPLPGTKVVVGDGPAREALQRQFPDVVWRGWRHGEDLAAHFASADCFVFPSRTDTFGMVVLEALACGLPVASVPAPGPNDLIRNGYNGALDEDLQRACLRAVTCSRANARASVDSFSVRASNELFRANLVPMRRSAAAEVEMPFAVAAEA